MSQCRLCNAMFLCRFLLEWFQHCQQSTNLRARRAQCRMRKVRCCFLLFFFVFLLLPSSYFFLRLISSFVSLFSCLTVLSLDPSFPFFSFLFLSFPLRLRLRLRFRLLSSIPLSHNSYGGTNGWCPPPYGSASTPCTTTSGFYLSVASGTAKIWAPAGQRYGKFTIVDPNNVQTSTCANCPAGQYQNVNQFSGTACKPCEVGYYQDQTGPDCKVCGTGTVQPATGQTSCSACPTGQNQPSTGQSLCPACSAGRYQDQTGQSSCTLCPTGTKQDQTLQVSCNNCQSGLYSDETGALACKACAVGQAQPSAGLTKCIDCSIGMYQDATSKTICKNCDSGQYQANTKQTSCNNCGIGRYQSGTGGSSCPGQCDCGYFCPAGSVNGRSEVCGEGFWCPSATTTKNALGDNMQGTPVGTNFARFCGQQACPYGSACKFGEARPNMKFNAPAACKSSSADAPYIVQINEDQTFSSFGAQFVLDVADAV